MVILNDEDLNHTFTREHAHVTDRRRPWDARVRGAGAVDGAAGVGEVRRVQLRDGAVRDPRAPP